MAKKHSYLFDDEHTELVKRYENYLSGASAGYFDVEEMGRIVDYYLMRGKTTESLKALEFGKKLHPDSGLLDLKRAKIYLATGNAQKANRILKNLVENTDPEVRFLKMETLIKLGKEREAYETALNMVEEEEDDKEWMCLDLALIFMTDGSFDYALDLLKKGEEFDNKNIDILFEKAFCFEQLSNYEAAIETYTKIIDIDPYMGEAWFNLGQVHFNRTQYEKALEAYDYALVINDSDSISLMQKGHVLYQLNRYAEAIEAYLEYLTFNSEKWSVMTFIGECYEKLENFPKSLQYYKLSLEEMPNNYDALVGAAICCLELEEYTESLSYIQSALELNDKAADVWVYYAETQIGLNNIDEALTAYLKSLALDPSQPDTLMAVASIYMDNSDFDRALKYYELAYSFDANLEMIELFMAVAYYYKNDQPNMEKYFRLAVQKNLDAIKLFQEFCPDATISQQ
ncbi:Tetratricopeptide TPR_1 repeat-containing protein [uncultured Paludibacter sp.]|uniref:Tetratricopeptide TPR_1 repeat-containing protein n=1 Tax=uncultured Paludibacter sp. TaxID=497635 RepID=A0A653A8D4_9BACT|nr:Tetratricopeptide TPR_1 repeat-containing protein [uncultured Paludibacter sp.]